MIRTIALAAATAAVLGNGSAAWAAAGNDTGAHRRTHLVLSFVAEAGYAGAVTLTCAPAGGGHPQPGKACRTLKRAAGDPGAIPAAGTLCFLIYAPVTAEVTGTWKGHAIEWRHTYGNRCELNRATGVLFAF